MDTPGRGAASLSPDHSLLWSLRWVARPVLLLAAIPLASIVDASWLWAASLFVIGMPHGAYDLAAIHQSTGGRLTSTAKVFTVYTAVMLACIAAFVVSPVLTLVAFLVLTAHHFGVSDSVPTRGRAASFGFDHVAGFARGIVVIAAPFAFQPAAAWEPFARMAGVVGARSSFNPDAIELVAGGLVCVSGAIVTLQAVRLFGRGNAAGAIEELAVPAAIVVIAMVVPPLLVVGAYFVCVHASGHCMRARTPTAPAVRATFMNAVRVHRRSVVLLVPSIAIVAALSAWAFGGLGTVAVALGFILFCVFATLPHHLLWLVGPVVANTPPRADADMKQSKPSG